MIKIIKGIGTDIIEIERIQKAVEKNNGFLNKLFEFEEIEYFKRKNNKAEHIAGSFAVKEAVSKALGTGFRGFGFKDIVICRDDLGKPYVSLKNGAEKIALDLGISIVNISISHSKENAIAFVVAE